MRPWWMTGYSCLNMVSISADMWCFRARIIGHGAPGHRRKMRLLEYTPRCSSSLRYRAFISNIPHTHSLIPRDGCEVMHRWPSGENAADNTNHCVLRDFGKALREPRPTHTRSDHPRQKQDDDHLVKMRRLNAPNYLCP